MPHDRFFTENDLAEGSLVSLADEELHHLTRVMRAKCGDLVECFNGKGKLAKAQVQKNLKELLVEHVSFQAPPLNPLEICQALVRPAKLELILEKGVELGMSRLSVFRGDGSEKVNISENQKKRFQKIIVNACKQSGQLWLPKLEEIKSLEAFQGSEKRLFFGDTASDALRFEDVWKKQVPKKGAVFFVGPEKGFSSREEKVLSDLGATGVKLSELILRTETAPIAAMSLMGHWG